MSVGGDPGAELIGLLIRERSNRRRIWVTLAVVLAAMAAILLDAFWMPWTTAGDRVLPFLGLVAVCGVGLWFADRLSRENQRLKERIVVLAEGLEGVVQEHLSRGQQEALEAQLSFNRKLVYALMVVGCVGGISLSVTLVMSMDGGLDDLRTGLGILVVASLCMGPEEHQRD